MRMLSPDDGNMPSWDALVVRNTDGMFNSDTSAAGRSGHASDVMSDPGNNTSWFIQPWTLKNWFSKARIGR